MMTVTIEIDSSFFANIRESLQRRIDNAQKVMVSTCKEKADDYTPMDTGNLKNHTEDTMNERGIPDGWKYMAPYAWRQWRGIRKDGSGYKYSLVTNDKARSRWTEHAALVHREEIMKAVLGAFNV